MRQVLYQRKLESSSTEKFNKIFIMWGVVISNSRIINLSQHDPIEYIFMGNNTVLYPSMNRTLEVPH